LCSIRTDAATAGQTRVVSVLQIVTAESRFTI
jgi:hypothetical protein